MTRSFSALSPNRSLRSQARSVKEFRYGEHVCKLSADSVVPYLRFHDPAGESVFANSSSVGAFNQWSAARSQSGTSSPAALPNADANANDPHAIRVETSTGPVYLPSLVTPRFAQGKRIRYAIYEYDPLIDSSEIEPTDWINIATDIERNYQSFDGFIVLHGTDTLAFSASALSFLLVREGVFLSYLLRSPD